MPTTYVIYAGDGIETDFTITFDRISNGHVNVYVDGGLVDTADYSVAGDTVSFDAAPSGIVELRRRTPDTPDVDFVAGSTYNAQDAQDAYTQALYRSAEVIEMTSRRFDEFAETEYVSLNMQSITGNGGKSYQLSELVLAPGNLLVLVSGQPQIPLTALLTDPQDPLGGAAAYGIYYDPVAEVSYLVFAENIPVTETITVYYITQTNVVTANVTVSTEDPVAPGTADGQIWTVV